MHRKLFSWHLVNCEYANLYETGFCPESTVSAFPSRIRVEVAAEPAGIFPNLFSDSSAWAPVLFTNSKAHRMSSHACVYVLHDSRRSLRHGRRRIFQNGKIHCRIYLSNSSSLSWLHKLLYASLWAFNVFKMSYSTDRSVIRQAVFHNGVSAFMTRCLTCFCDSSWAFISSLRFPHVLKRARDGTGRDGGGGGLLYTQLTKICSENVMLTFPLSCEILKVLKFLKNVHSWLHRDYMHLGSYVRENIKGIFHLIVFMGTLLLNILWTFWNKKHMF